MTEAEWLASNDPAAMLVHVSDVATPRQMDCIWNALTPAIMLQPLNNWNLLPAAVATESAALLRDIFGNPWRPIVALINPGTEKALKAWTSAHRGEAAWIGTEAITPQVVSVAQRIYDERAFGDLPVLADMLEEAGCDQEDLLRHLRGQETCLCDVYQERKPHPNGLNLPCYQCQDGWIPLRGPHVRGCWALDLILGNA